LKKKRKEVQYQSNSMRKIINTNKNIILIRIKFLDWLCSLWTQRDFQKFVLSQ